MAQFKPSLLMMALAAAGLSSSLITSTVYAEEAEQEEKQQVEQEAAVAADSAQANEVTFSDDDEIENLIVVKGFRGSLIRSLNSKRFADTISEQISADELAANAGTINYEIVCSLGNRLPKVYK